MLNEVLGTVEKLAEIGGNLTDADQQQLRLLLHEHKRLKKACDIAEQIFDGTLDTKFFGDNSFIGTDAYIKTSTVLSERIKKQYSILRESFNKYD